MAVDEVDALRLAMQRLLRAFGALELETTPCGKPLSLAHAHALMTLLARGELTQQELGLELNIDKSNVARLCAKMAEAEHITQRPNERDARSRLVGLTSRGERLAREVANASRERFDALWRALPKARRLDAAQVLSDITTAIVVSSSVSKAGTAR